MSRALLEELSQRGIQIVIRGDKVVLSAPKGLITPEVVAQVGEQKQELMLLLRGYHMKYPGPKASSKELKEIQKRVRDEGFVLLWSTVLQDLVAFFRDEESRSKIPPGFVPYSEAELKELFGDGNPSLSISALRLIHETKKYGGRVINRSKSVDDHCES